MPARVSQKWHVRTSGNVSWAADQSSSDDGHMAKWKSTRLGQSHFLYGGCGLQLQKMLCLIQFARWRHLLAAMPRRSADMLGATTRWRPTVCGIKARVKVCHLRLPCCPLQSVHLSRKCPRSITATNCIDQMCPAKHANVQTATNQQDHVFYY